MSPKSRLAARNGAIYLAVAVSAAFAAFPVYWMLVTGLQRSQDLYVWPPRLLPNFSQLDVFVRLFTTQPLLLWLKNSAVIAIGVAVLAVGLSIPAAYSLSRFRFKLRVPLLFTLLLTQMIPSTVLIVPLFITMRETNLLNTHIGVILADTAVIAPVAVWILKAFFDTIPGEVSEAAMVDGCSHLGTLWHITLPLAKPSIAAASALCFFEAWNEYAYALTFLTDQAKWVTSVGLASWIGWLTTPVEIMMSGAIVFAFPSVVLFLVLQRQLVSGLAAGAIK